MNSNNKNQIITTAAILTVVALAASVIVFNQQVAADKDCSVGKALRGKPSNFGEVVSDSAHQGGNGGVFAGFNRGCHSD
jgi:hypothetical protein